MERPDGPAKGAGTPERGLGRLVGFCGCGCGCVHGCRGRLRACVSVVAHPAQRAFRTHPCSLPRRNGPFARIRARFRGATALRRRLARRFLPKARKLTSGPSERRFNANGPLRSLSDLQTPMRRDALLPEGPQHRSCHRSVWRLAFNAEALRRHAKFLSTLESAHRISLSASLANLGVENRPRFPSNDFRPAPGPPTPMCPVDAQNPARHRNPRSDFLDLCRGQIWVSRFARSRRPTVSFEPRVPRPPTHPTAGGRRRQSAPAR